MRYAGFALLFLATVAVDAGAQSRTDNGNIAQAAPASAYWSDPSTGLMWAGKDNGRDVSWKKAVKYCRDLRLAGYSEWRLANMIELQSIYDKNADSPGLAGKHDAEPMMWHVKGNLFLTGDQWSANYRTNERGHNNGYEYYFDFNEGRADNQPSGFPYPSSLMRALCVRGSAK